jgi:5-formyltetrahydrofolate cyclo-ligase
MEPSYTMRATTHSCVDLVVSGSVAIDRHGARVGKGAGFADLEFALLSRPV